MMIDWTTVIASAITAIVVGGSQFVANRYLARMLDRIEKSLVRNHYIGENVDED